MCLETSNLEMALQSLDAREAPLRVASAGVLCFSERVDGKIVVLLGREKETIGWRQGSNKWSSFSGRIEAGEEVSEGAAREFVEESLAVVPLTTSMTTPVCVSDVSEVLRSKGRQIQLYMRGREQSAVPAVMHVSFLQKVPYVDYPVRFRALRTVLLECDTRFRAYHKTKKSADCLPRLLFPGYRLSSVLTVISGRVLRQGTVELSIWDDILGVVLKQHICLSGAAAREAHDVYETWADVLNYIERNKNHHALSHPAVSIQRVSQFVVGAYVNKCYLEKSEMKWWSVEELERAGKQRPQEFRRFFGDAIPELVAAVRSAAECSTGSEQPSVKNNEEHSTHKNQQKKASVPEAAEQVENWRSLHSQGRSWDRRAFRFTKGGGGK